MVMSWNNTRNISSNLATKYPSYLDIAIKDPSYCSIFAQPHFISFHAAAAAAALVGPRCKSPHLQLRSEVPYDFLLFLSKANALEIDDALDLFCRNIWIIQLAFKDVNDKFTQRKQRDRGYVSLPLQACFDMDTFFSRKYFSHVLIYIDVLYSILDNLF